MCMPRSSEAGREDSGVCVCVCVRARARVTMHCVLVWDVKAPLGVGNS